MEIRLSPDFKYCKNISYIFRVFFVLNKKYPEILSTHKILLLYMCKYRTFKLVTKGYMFAVIFKFGSMYG